MNKILSNTMTLAALLGFGALANFAVAADYQPGRGAIDHKSVMLHFADLDPAVPADASALLARLRTAVDEACIRNDERRQIFRGPDRKACIGRSYAAALTGINRKLNVDLEAVAALHRADSNPATAAR